MPQYRADLRTAAKEHDDKSAGVGCWVVGWVLGVGCWVLGVVGGHRTIGAAWSVVIPGLDLSLSLNREYMYCSLHNNRRLHCIAVVRHA